MYAVIDLETTGNDPTTAEIVEWALLYVSDEHIVSVNHGLVSPSIPIPPESSAIHHIIDEDVEDCPAWEGVGGLAVRSTEYYRDRITALVAHNADFERHFIEPLLPGIPWLCTYKAALRIWPEAPSHSNEGLRYWLELPNRGRRCRQEPHSAVHDAAVTAQILQRLLRQASPSEMISWAREPAMLPRCPIGKYRNLPWAEVPEDFLEWILYKAVDMRADIMFCARREIERRHDIKPDGHGTICDGELPF